MSVQFAKKVLETQLSVKNLLSCVRKRFQRVQDHLTKSSQRSEISLVDCLMSGLAIFGLKFPSLLQFEQGKEDKLVQHNLKALYKLVRIPCDTYLRERMDEIDPKALRCAFKDLFALVQRNKALEQFQYLEEGYLVSLDGTGYFSSHEVSCKNCCKKEHKDGVVTYYHQMLGGVIVHPEKPTVIPFCPEPILKSDGLKKNDCERNASKRFLNDLRREHPHLKIVVIEDALASNLPHIKHLLSLDMNFILGVKPGGNSSLFKWVNGICEEFEIEKDGHKHRFRYVNAVPLNDQSDLEVNFLEYFETDSKGKRKHFSWVTSIPISRQNAERLMKSGRARWRVENETFNTLKNQGYHFEHNFGHGKKNLSTVFAFLMFLAFAIDQIQQTGCKLFQKALGKAGRKKYLWDKIRCLFFSYFINSWSDLLGFIAYNCHGAVLTLDSS